MRRSAICVIALAAAFSLTHCNQPRRQVLNKEQQAKVKKNLLKDANPLHKVGANFANKLELMGVDFSPARVRPGGPLRITYYWKCLGSIRGDWKIFVHWDKNQRVGDDHYPVDNLFKFNQCKKGQIVKDVRNVVAHRGFSGGTSTLYVGIYPGRDSTGGGRMRVISVSNTSIKATADHRVPAAQIPIVGAHVPRNPLARVSLPRYVVRPLEGKITLDGKLDEPAWKNAKPTRRFVNPHGRGPTAPTYAKFLYDNENLYIGFVALADRNLFNSVTKNDGETWNQDVVEVFIDADNDQKTYLELHVTPSNTQFDALFLTHKKPDWRLARTFVSHMRSAVHAVGTVNKSGDVDTMWSVEIIVPIKHLKPYIKNVPPKVGDIWRVNLFRRDYTPKVGRIGAHSLFASWSASGGDFHNLQRFGYLHFGAKLPTVVRPVMKGKTAPKPSKKQLSKSATPPRPTSQPKPKSTEKK